MDCTALYTAAEILEAFRTCKNAGEQIDLFECLATRPDPPVGAFVELLQNIKLEPVVALTIQAFGQITDAETRDRVKQSDDLLTMLSQQAQSGATDLIRWAAASTIDKIGFNFIAVSRHLLEEPRNIADNILQSKLKRFGDSQLLERDDYNKFVQFWTYGALEQLKEISLGWDHWLDIDELPKNRTCQKVMNNLDLKGLNDVNAALQRAERMGNNAWPIDENKVFEWNALLIAEQKLNDVGGAAGDDVALLIAIQLHCLQSNEFHTRKHAAAALSKVDKLLEKLKPANPNLAIGLVAASLFNQDWYICCYRPSNQVGSTRDKERFIHVPSQTVYTRSYDSVADLPTKNLEVIASQLDLLVQNFRRKKVIEDCKAWCKRVRRELEAREKQARDSFI